MRTPISYYGGKQRLAHQIVAMMPKHSTYVEPFFGGGAVFFLKPKASIEFINDLDEDLINVYRVMQDKDKADRFLRMVEYTPHSEAEYARAGDVLRNKSHYSDICRAWAYFIYSQQSFSSILGAGWGRKKHKRNGPFASEFNTRKTSLYLALDRLENVSICCEDALSLIDRFNHEDFFLFLDPPYPGTYQRYNRGGFTADHMQNLIDKMDSSKSKFILTMYDCGVSVPRTWRREQVNTLCLSKKIKRGEDREIRTEVILSRL